MTKTGVRQALLAATSASVLLLGSAPVMAGAFALREQSAAAQGQSFAGAASGSGGLSSMYWNPATITMQPGWNNYINGSYIDVDGRITPTAGTSPLLGNAPSGNVGQGAAVPATYSSHQINEYLWLGMSANAPYGLVTKPNNDWAGQIYSRTSRIYTINFNPIIGIKVNDWLSLAIGPTIEYFTVKLKRATSFLPGAPTAELRGDDVDYGFTAGMTLKPFAGTTIGVGYRSTMNHDLTGRLNTTTALIPIRSTVATPDLVTVGVTQAITNEFRLNFGYEFSSWSRLKDVRQVADTGSIVGVTVNTLPLRYKDGHFVSFGMEYDVNQQITVRAGAAYEWSPITEAVRSPSVPDANRIWASVGGSYRYSDKITVDFAYSHIFGEDARIVIQPGSAQLVTASIPVPGVGIRAIPLTFNADVKANVDIFSAALRYKWDDTRVAQPAAIIRKY